ncbi:hypothetical protein FEM48_Zijuj10G0040800 [Ziziphus jujuba var. spinosa]|uniref:Uncharacterized protein n=1 Tax=Ziziphus jujuba var. spinosa TaxID=714518 RepID=A0A978UL69_ZIZJJ|nr:hypothetical protein FEM48_Zijuj10G0040800 [Ziziphus jujuba var. spinosa]
MVTVEKVMETESPSTAFLFCIGRQTPKSGIDHQLTLLNLFKVEFLLPMYYLMLVDVGPGDKKCVTRRFVFEASKISVLKNSIACEVKSPSRVEVVMALLYKCAISASTKGSPIIQLQTMNLRRRIEPPLPNNIVGNFIQHFKIPTKYIQRNEEKIGCLYLICIMHALK